MIHSRPTPTVTTCVYYRHHSTATTKMHGEGEAVLDHYASIAGTGTEYDTEVEKEVVDTFIR